MKSICKHVGEYTYSNSPSNWRDLKEWYSRIHNWDTVEIYLGVKYYYGTLWSDTLRIHNFEKIDRIAATEKSIIKAFKEFPFNEMVRWDGSQLLYVGFENHTFPANLYIIIEKSTHYTYTVTKLNLDPYKLTMGFVDEMDR